MRRLVTTLALSAAAAGCASRVPVAGADRLAPIPPPLQARLHPPMPGAISYWVSRRAYIAIFELIPDHGVSLIYPAFPWQEARTDGGSRWAHLSTIPGRWFYFAGTPVRSPFPSPRYLYLVASERPLRIGHFQRNPNLLRRALDDMSFAVVTPRLTTDAIDRLIVPNLEADDWVSDLYVLWPEIPPPLPPRAVLALARYHNPFLLIPSAPDSAAPPDTTGAPRDSVRAPKGTDPVEHPGVRTPRREKIREGEDDDGRRRNARTVAESEMIDVPWSPLARDEGASGRAGARARSGRSSRDDWEPDRAWQRGRHDPGSRDGQNDPAWRHPATRQQEASAGRRSDETAARGGRAEGRAEPPRAEPRSEPRSEPRGEPRSEPRAEPRRPERGAETPQPAPARSESRGEPSRPPRSSEPR